MKRNFSVIYKSLFQLKPFELWNYIIYQTQLKLGVFRFRTPIVSKNKEVNTNTFDPNWFNFWIDTKFDRKGILEKSQIIKRADNIVGGKIQLFGLIDSELNLSPGISLHHWSKSRSKTEASKIGDIKFIWEPARFSWGIKLSQAYHLSKNEKYADYFWKKFLEFSNANPLNIGSNWESAQEVALRLIAFIISANLLNGSSSSSEKRVHRLFISIADHADRILPTLSYAKAQNNNHLISEAVGLYSAGTFLKHHPNAEKWLVTGKQLFDFAIQHQIDSNGEYIQHSTNYHRMMLTLSIWMQKMLSINNDAMNADSNQKLQNAVLWLYDLLDDISGQVPNLGHNDGSQILPFSSSPYQDYRPVIQASSTAFIGKSLLDSGKYNDMGIWLGLKINKKQERQDYTIVGSNRIGDHSSWGTMRACRYNSRPAHADQLHVDIWYKGINVFQDAGTYQYNGSPPWDNGLSSTQNHNTISIAGKDQMTRAGRFLWLDWAQAHVSQHSENIISAAHDGYIERGIVHERKLSRLTQTHWQVFDKLYKLKAAKGKVEIRQHWLLPDWPFEFSENYLIFNAPFGRLQIKISTDDHDKDSSLLLFKAGKSITSSAEDEPLLGWYSPTYGVKLPATTIVFSIERKLPIEITSDFFFD